MLGSKVWAIIPARYGSTRLPGKPLLPIAGKPMFAHVAQRAQEAGVETSCIAIATDDERIANSASEQGIRALMTCSHHDSGSDRVLEAAQKIGAADEDLILNLQGDEPFVPPLLISSLVQYASKSPFSISTVSVPIEVESQFYNENSVKVVLGDKGRAIYFSRAGIPFERGAETDFRSALRHIGVYCYQMKALKQFCSSVPPSLEGIEKLEQLRALYYGLDIGCIVFNGTVPIGVDTQAEYDELLKIYGV